MEMVGLHRPTDFRLVNHEFYVMFVSFDQFVEEVCEFDQRDVFKTFCGHQENVLLVYFLEELGVSRHQ